MHRILTRPVMQALDESLTRAERAVRGESLFTRRVGVARCNAGFAVHFLAARDALNRGDLEAAYQSTCALRADYEAGTNRFPCFVGAHAWTYYRLFHHRAFTDAGRIAREGRVLYRFPNAWSAFLDKDGIGRDDQLYLPGLDVSNWLTLRTCGESLDEQGFPFFRGTIWYRHDFVMPPAGPGSRRIFLWFGGIDDTAEVYLNGRALGKLAPGSFGSAEVDVTTALNRSGVNTLAVAVSNLGLTELGTGGLCRPVLLYELLHMPAE